MSFIELKHLNKFYPISGAKDFQALKDINLSLDKGELVSIIGESGSGKSTLMNLLGGLDSQFSGEITVDGKKMSTFKDQDFVNYHKEKIGFVFQSFNLVSHLSVLDNVTLAMTLSNVDKKTRNERAKEVLKQLGLEEQYHKKPSQLSGGQKQRVAIARALVNDPDIIIADEPTGALDSQTTDQVLDIIQEIAKTGKLVIMVTHSEKVAARSTRVVTIDDGKIIGDVRQGELQTHENTFGLEKKAKSKNLSFFAAIRLALLNMKEKLGRNILIALGGSIGIMSVIVMLSLGAGVNDYLTKTMNANVNPLVSEVKMPIARGSNASSSVAADSSVMATTPAGTRPSGPPAGVTQSDPFAEENLQELRNIPHVAELNLAYTSFTIGSDNVIYEGSKYAFMTFGTTSGMTDSNILYGTFPAEGEILVTEGIANQMGATAEEAIGKEVTLSVTIDGEKLEKNYVISGIYTAGQSIGAFESVYISSESFDLLTAENNLEVKPNVVYLVSDDPKNTQAIKDEVATLGYRGSSADMLASTFTKMLDIFTYILSGVAGISLFVSAIMILTVLYISVVERTQEIGVIKAIGGRKKDIRRIFVSESFLIGLFSGLLGVGIAYLITVVGNIIVQNLFDTAILNMTPAFAIFGIVTSIIISMLSGLLPAQKAASLDPVEALRHD
ncbi:abc transporter permease protein domain [Trichococcus palustris]|jgi:putative ABC transport system permease protein|uniref:Abc transporter permease protein domain n=1 Tax=Trichococcus palustris TaxID=140314 RepID=A0A143YXV4_9LACT|nr:ABC transporter ATP-binding protein/permease [Trichococcus palustris]CZR01253.1 abc transporter permease protein domain [Trichococcus palustris]SFL07403.1 ABC-type lipoprotein export system, ATPase component [Trichococcus palustris]